MDHITSRRPGLTRRAFLGTAAAALAAANLAGVPSARAESQHWVGTWATAVVSQNPSANNRVNDQTLRQIVHVSVGGTQVRVKLSNAFGTGSVVVGAAHVALRDAGEAIVPGSGRVLTFGGQPSIVISPGAQVFSDPADLEVPALSDLAIDLYLPGDTSASTSPITTHTGARQTNYVSIPGDHTGAIVLPVASTRTSWLFLAAVDVLTTKQTGAIVALGDSITDGTASTNNTNNRWPDQLARRIMAQPGNRHMGVLNLGIAGNRVITGGAGPNAQSRLDRDVLAQTGATHLIILEGINDSSNAVFQADLIIAGLNQIVQRARAKGLKVYGGTLTPAGQPAGPPNTREANRLAVNAWIRESGVFDAVIDFDAVTRDPANPTFFLPEYDSGDHLHPGDVGYQAMGDAIDLGLFK